MGEETSSGVTSTLISIGVFANRGRRFLNHHKDIKLQLSLPNTRDLGAAGSGPSARALSRWTTAVLQALATALPVPRTDVGAAGTRSWRWEAAGEFGAVGNAGVTFCHISTAAAEWCALFRTQSSSRDRLRGCGQLN